MIKVELIYGHSPTQIYIWKHKYEEPITVEKVVDDSRVLEVFKLNKGKLFYAIFDNEVKLDAEVKDGDRVSVLRPTERNGRRG